MMAETCCNRKPYRVAVFQPFHGIKFLFMAFSVFTRSLAALQSTRFLNGIHKDSRSFSLFRRTPYLPMAYPVSVSSNIDDTHCPAIGPFSARVFNSFHSMAHDEPVVSPDWLQANLRMSDVKVLDASWYMPDEQRNPFQEYQVAHIPGALFFDVDGISDRKSDLPHMLPSEEAFAAAVSAFGIQNKDGVVVYDGKGIFSSARVWWMFRVFGHDKVWVLDGGLPHWRASGFEVESSASGDAVLKASAAIEAIEMIYQQQPVVGFRTFEAKLQTHLIWTLEQVRENVDGETRQHVDARSKARFEGVAPEPRKGVRAGHVPGSKCLPFGQMLDESQKLLPKNVLLKKFEQEGISLDRPIVTSCGTGVTACILALGLHRLGKTDVPVYDGSWTEWGSRLDTPINTN